MVIVTWQATLINVLVYLCCIMPNFVVMYFIIITAVCVITDTESPFVAGVGAALIILNTPFCQNVDPLKCLWKKGKYVVAQWLKLQIFDQVMCCHVN